MLRAKDLTNGRNTGHLYRELEGDTKQQGPEVGSLAEELLDGVLV